MIMSDKQRLSEETLRRLDEDEITNVASVDFPDVHFSNSSETDATKHTEK